LEEGRVVDIGRALVPLEGFASWSNEVVPSLGSLSNLGVYLLEHLRLND
jgi:hypothetical protein